MNDGPLNLARAAEYLGIAKGSLRNLAGAGKVTFYKPGGKLLFFNREDLDAYAYRNRKLSDFEASNKAEAILNR